MIRLTAAALAVTAMVSPVWAKEVSFLEAALFFITGVDATSEDAVSESQITLRRYPIVAYLADQCTVRIRTTTVYYTIWQMDFCKFTGGYRRSSSYGGLEITWYGRKDTLCIYKDWDQNANYYGRINDDNSKCNPLGGGGPEGYIAWNSVFGLYSLLPQGALPPYKRSPDRMMDAYKYIQSLLTGKPY